MAHRKGHQDSCPFELTACPNEGCMSRVPRGALAEHRQHCQHGAHQRCPLGCGASLPLSHLSRNYSSHPKGTLGPFALDLSHQFFTLAMPPSRKARPLALRFPDSSPSNVSSAQGSSLIILSQSTAQLPPTNLFTSFIASSTHGSKSSTQKASPHKDSQGSLVTLFPDLYSFLLAPGSHTGFLAPKCQSAPWLFLSLK